MRVIEIRRQTLKTLTNGLNIIQQPGEKTIFVSLLKYAQIQRPETLRVASRRIRRLLATPASW